MLNTERFLRQLDLVTPERLVAPITVIGAGAIGSAAVVTLAKMGCTDITVWDHDTLEEHNMPNQICRTDMVGRPKVEALAKLTRDLTDVEIRTENRRYRGQKLRSIVVVAVDTMDARQAVWRRVRMDPDVPLLIDGRMGAEFARVYTVRPSDPADVDYYEQNLYPAAQAERLPCSARSIIYCPTVIGGLIALLVKKHAMNEPSPREILLDLPGLSLVADTQLNGGFAYEKNTFAGAGAASAGGRM